MASRFQKQETVRLEISQGDWLLVRKRLTAGEQREMFARMVKVMRAGEKAELNPAEVGTAQVVTYLVDWSLLDPQDKPVVVRGKSADAVTKILNDLPTDDFAEIAEAIETHIAAMDAERDTEKKIAAGESAP